MSRCRFIGFSCVCGAVGELLVISKGISDRSGVLLRAHRLRLFGLAEGNPFWAARVKISADKI